jgi:hypothetical protein
MSLNAALIGFHRLKKRHTGLNMAKTILYLLDRANATLRVCIRYYIRALRVWLTHL